MNITISRLNIAETCLRKTRKSDAEVEKEILSSTDTRDAAIEFARQNLQRAAGEMPVIYEERNGQINIQFEDGASTSFRKFEF